MPRISIGASISARHPSRSQRASCGRCSPCIGRLGELPATDETQRNQALAEPNVRYLGLAAPERLPDIYAAASLGFIPYQTNPMLVESGFSLKALEMAASGLPVVSSLMRPLCGLARALHVAADDNDFVAAVGRLDRVQISDADRDELIAAARANDYDAKFASVLQLCDRQILQPRPLPTVWTVGAAQFPKSSDLLAWHQLYTRWWLADDASSSLERDSRAGGRRLEHAMLCRERRGLSSQWPIRGWRSAHHRRLGGRANRGTTRRMPLCCWNTPALAANSSDLSTADASLAEARTVLAALACLSHVCWAKCCSNKARLARHRECGAMPTATCARPPTCWPRSMVACRSTLERCMNLAVRLPAASSGRKRWLR